MPTRLHFICNGSPLEIDVEDHWSLLYLIREKLGLIGTKEGCGSGECGACTVIVDNKAVNSCLYPAPEINGKSLLTIEGLTNPDGSLHPIQKAFVEKGAIQCGFCTSGMIMSAKALLDENPNPTTEDIQHALAGNICRCTGYVQIFDAVHAASQSDNLDVSVVAWREK